METPDRPVYFTVIAANSRHLQFFLRITLIPNRDLQAFDQSNPIIVQIN